MVRIKVNCYHLPDKLEHKVSILVSHQESMCSSGKILYIFS